ncbi:MAG: PAS domain-containing protein [Verrucomicrobia bacterium]|nr:PAS domain-containing protein [Verrucomicrobiota bacterium]
MPGEAARVAAVNALGVLNRPPEPLFERLTSMTARACGVSHAVLALLDQSHFRAIASFGLVAAEAPRERCLLAGRVLSDPDVFSVEDAAAQELFRHDAWTQDPFGARGFAGKALLTPDGQLLGLLAVFDRVPRLFSTTERHNLRENAALALAILQRTPRVAAGTPAAAPAVAAVPAQDHEIYRQLLEPSPVTPRLRRWLELVGQRFRASRAQYLRLRQEPGGDDLTALLREEWCAPHTSPQIVTGAGLRLDADIFPPDVVPRWTRAEPFAFLREQAPPLLAEILRKAGARSVVGCSAFAAGVPFALVLLHDCDAPREWSSEEQQALGALTASLGLALDTEYQQFRLQDQRERLEATLLALGDPTLMTDRSGLVELANPAAQRLLGRTASDLGGRPLESFFTRRDPRKESDDPPPAGPLRRVLEMGETVFEQTGLWALAANGGAVSVGGHTAPIRDTTGAIRGTVRVFRDITGEEKMRTEALRADQYEKVVSLAGGVAHGFNNALTSISGNLSLAGMTLRQQPDDALASLQEAQLACDTARDLAGQLLAFTRGAAPVKKVQMLSNLVEEQVTIALRGTNVQAVFTLPEDLPLVELDSELFGRVVRNLTMNAADAMPQGGKLEVWAVARALGEGHPTGLPPGRYVKLCFEDEGSGIPPELLPRVFSPFFTTKAGASGLGLSAVYSIVRQHGGDVNVDSIVGHGTIFRLYLPATRTPGPPEETLEAPSSVARVLVLDDEESVRNLTVRVLHQLGYGGRATGDGDSLLREYERARANGNPYSAVLLDLTIQGGPGGLDVLQKLRRLDPEVRAIAMSGYMVTLDRDELRGQGFIEVLPKPYAIAEIAAVMQLATQPASAT